MSYEKLKKEKRAKQIVRAPKKEIKIENFHRIKYCISSYNTFINITLFNKNIFYFLFLKQALVRKSSFLEVSVVKKQIIPKLKLFG